MDLWTKCVDRRMKMMDFDGLERYVTKYNEIII